jgi:hypothetical protein
MGVNLGLINLCLLFLDTQSAPNKGSVGAQNKTYVRNVCPRWQQELRVSPLHVFFGLWGT